MYVYLNQVCKIMVFELVCKKLCLFLLCRIVVLSSICCTFKYLSCLYHLRPPSRGTIGIVSIGPWVEKGPSN